MHIIRKVAHRIDPDIPDEQIERAVASRLKRFARALEEVPASSLTALTRLRSRGRKIALISNADVTEVAAWPKSPLAPLMDTVVFSCEVGAKKPDPEIYTLTLSKLNVEPSEAIFVGDGGSHELKGAQGVGLTTVMMQGFIRHTYPELVPDRRAYADFVIDDLRELSADS